MSDLDGARDEVVPGVWRLYPDKVTDAKYVSLFVKRRGGNLLFPCVGGHSNIESHFDWIEGQGGIAHQIIGDMHFAAKYNDLVSERFGVPALCSDIEGPDVKRKVKRVETFPFERFELAPRVEVIPTPGHRPGAVSVLVTLGKRKLLFAGDTIYHDGRVWRCYTSKKNAKTMRATLGMLEAVPFDAVFANTSVTNPVCHAELDAKTRPALLADVLSSVPA